MAGAHAAAKNSNINIPGQGHLSLAPDANAPLLVVFGGIDVHGTHSGVYMWNYMNALKGRFQIFVALSNTVNGTLAYRALTKTLESKQVTPSEQILYLFSGGFRPGIDVLSTSGPNVFSEIYLVDIWMGSSKVAEFYKMLANNNAAKMTYVYTSFGANNEAARDYIAGKLGVTHSTLVQGGVHEAGMHVHMRTNTTALSGI